MEGLPYRTSLRAKKFIFCFYTVVFTTAGAKSEMSHPHSSLSVSAPHLHHTCPEGATVKLMCAQGGVPLHKTDILRQSWFFTPHSDERCKNQRPRHINNGHSHGNHSLPPGLRFGSSEHNFWVILQNVTYADQGRYCCVILDVEKDHNHNTIKQTPHSHILLTVIPKRNGSQDCTVWDSTPSGSSVAVALAVAACILALLSLPLILVLVYKQRQSAHSSRRGQELVRMDSEAHGHENPVFLGGSPQIKTRTVSQIMTRQSSETGRHLLSEPGTPLSPPAHGDVFFPVEATIPEFSDSLPFSPL